MGGAEGVLTTLSDCTTVGQYDWHQIPISFGDGSETVKYGFWLQTERGFIPNSFSFPVSAYLVKQIQHTFGFEIWISINTQKLEISPKKYVYYKHLSVMY